MKNKAGILNIKSKKSRNRLRGLIADPKSLQTIKALEKIYSEGGEKDFQAAIEILKESPLFKRGLIGGNFNTSLPRTIDFEHIGNLKPAQITGKFSTNRKKLSILLSYCEKILQAIGAGQFDRAYEFSKLLKENGGASIALVRYLCFIKNHSNNKELNYSIDKLLEEISIINARYIHNAIRELTSENTDYLNILEKIQKSARSIGTLIARSFIDPIPRSAEIFSATLSSYYQYSLLDAYLYIYRLRPIELNNIENIDTLSAVDECEFAQVVIDLSKLYKPKDSSVGLHIFRETFLLNEIDELFNYRLVHQFYFNNSPSKEVGKTPYEHKLVRKYFATVQSISCIGQPIEYVNTDQSETYIEKYDAEKACHFQNSTALAFLLDRKDGKIEGDEVGFVRAMSITRDIGIIVTSQHIEQIKIDAKRDELRIVTSALSHIKQRGQLREHELRSIIQEVAARSFDANLLDLLEHVYTISPAVAEHLLQIMDETFLSKLFSIIPDPNQAIQERANLLEWYGKKVDDLTFLERAKNLRIDVQINKARGTIDDSRIYVDPVKFTQWISDNLLNDFTLLFESLPQPIESQLIPIAWEKVKTGISKHEQIAALILECYEEFCSNTIFGVASYLGRRIRHGTLKGTGFSEIKNMAVDTQYGALFESREFDDLFHKWLKVYESTLDNLRDHYLHISSKTKPDGLLSKEFRTNSKRTVASHMMRDILDSYSNSGSSVEVPYIVLEYCWRIVEEDLSTIRRFLMEQKAQNAVFRHPDGQLASSHHRDFQVFTKTVNSLTAEKFRMISSWFNKPSIASPSADVVLLFKAVVSEIRSHFPDYCPKVSTTEDQFILDGGAYFNIYDALFILIHNAAASGKLDGHLSLNVHLDKRHEGKHVAIVLSSELRSQHELPQVKYAIESALAEDCEDALVTEGRSGIKKLKRMQQAGIIDNVEYRFEQSQVHASFSFRINY
jgi:hypothetical protein